MAVRRFCGAAANFAVVDPATGAWLPDDSGSAWDSPTGGTQYEVQDHLGFPLADGVLTTIGPGFVQEFIIDQDPPVEAVWLDFGGDNRVYVECNDRASYRVGPDQMGQPNGVATLDGTGRVQQPVPAGRISGKVTNAQIETVGSEKILSPPWLRTEDYTPGGVPDLLAELPRPILYAHRGDRILPENTLEGFRAVVAAGANAIELDAWRLADGTMGVMHDSTVDRTTNGSGPMDNFTTSTFQALIVNGGTQAPSWDGREPHPPLLEDVIREFADRVFISVNVKNASAVRGAIEVCDRYVRNKSNVIWSVGGLEHLAADIIDAGYNVITEDDGVTTPSEYLLDGFFGVTWNQSVVNPVRVSEMKDAGLFTQTFTAKSYTQYEQLAATGVDAIMCDEVPYFQNRFIRATDPYAALDWWYGYRVNPGINNADAQGFFGDTNQHGLSNAQASTGQTASESGVLQAWGCPIKGQPNADDYVIEFDAHMESWNGAASNFSVAISNQDEVVWGGGAPQSSGMAGYWFRRRQGGQIAIVRLNGDGTEAELATADGTSPGNVFHRYRITVEPGRIEFEDLDEGISCETTDTSAPRGGFFFVGAGGSNSQFRNVQIT